MVDTSRRVEKDCSAAAIVTTLRGADAYLESFSRYHLTIGFDHLYLFLDTPDEPVPAWLRHERRVTLIRREAPLEALWRELSAENELLRTAYDWRDREVMARQLLNVRLAIRLAAKAGHKWLLSIDVDELFHCGRGTVAAHFNELEELGVRQIHYANHELVPQAHQPCDILRNETLFKLSPSLVDDYQRLWFRHRFPRRLGYFNYYHWGKAAARLLPGLLPGMTVHEFTLPGQSLPSLQAAFERKVRSSREPSLCVNPCILHYAIGSCAEFVKKYRILGSFPDRWFGSGVDIAATLPFHTAARDAVADKDPRAAENFFREHVLIPGSEIDGLLERGICSHIHAPSRVLAAGAKPLGGPQPP